MKIDKFLFVERINCTCDAICVSFNEARVSQVNHLRNEAVVRLGRQRIHHLLGEG